MSKLAFIFPGQGSQEVGMGRALADNFAAARAVFEEVDEALGENLSSLIWEGPIETLTLTANTQPALMAVSLAAMAALREARGITIDRAGFVAGHSLGEYSALCAAGALTVGETARLLRTRGEAMQAAVPAGEGAMAALLGADPDQAEAACRAGAAAGGVCEIANDNAPGQLVLSGSRVAIAAACDWARSNGVKKAVPLAVSAPFHCSLMQPAAEVMAEALSAVTLRAPAVPVVTNVTAAPETDPGALGQGLVAQVTGRVRWRESVLFLAANGVTATAEAGAGKVLSVMNRRTDRSLTAHALATPEDIEAFSPGG